MPELDEQLRLLVQQYGIAEVQRRLRVIMGPRLRSSARKSARDCVTGMELQSNKKERLLTLAQLFEEKRFLPKTADIRNFFGAYGPAPMKFKSRQDAILQTFRFLSSLSDEQLDRIINEGSFAGPSELGPIADAIKAKSADMRHADDSASSAIREINDLDPLRGLGKTNA